MPTFTLLRSHCKALNFNFFCLAVANIIFLSLKLTCLNSDITVHTVVALQKIRPADLIPYMEVAQIRIETIRFDVLIDVYAGIRKGIVDKKSPVGKKKLMLHNYIMLVRVNLY